MSRASSKPRGFYSTTWTIGLCVVGSTLVIALLLTGGRHLSADAETQSTPSGRIRLGLPIPTNVVQRPVESAGDRHLTVNQTFQNSGGQSLKIIPFPTHGNRGVSEHRVSPQRRNSAVSAGRRYHQIAQERELSPGSHQRADDQDSIETGRQSWSIPGAYELSRMAQRPNDEVLQADGVGQPQPFGVGDVEKPVNPKVVDPVVEESAVSSPKQAQPNSASVAPAMPPIQQPAPIPQPPIETTPQPQPEPMPAPPRAQAQPSPVAQPMPEARPSVQPPAAMPFVLPPTNQPSIPSPEIATPAQEIFVPPPGGYPTDVELNMPPVTSEHSYDATQQTSPQQAYPVQPQQPNYSEPRSYLNVPPVPLTNPGTVSPVAPLQQGHIDYGGQYGPGVHSPPPMSQQLYDASPNSAAFGHSGPTIQSFGHSMSGAFPGTSGFRATVEFDAEHWMAPYTARAASSDPSSFQPVIPSIPDIPSGFKPWWNAAVQRSVGTYSASHAVDVSSLLQDAMVHSPQVIAIKTEPEVQYRVTTQEAARFDWTAFLEMTYDDLNDPVGNDLTTGNGEDRLRTRKAFGAAGFRRRNIAGGEFRIAQEVGHENQNSRFFVPNDQGSSRLELSYRQPLLDGAGQTYNQSEIILAQIQANSSEDDVVDALQGHLTEVTEAYWTLYRSRAEFFQRQKLLASAQDVLRRLEGRSQVDTIPRQILRARAAVARSQTRIQRTLARVKDAEAQLRLLVNSPAMLNGGQTELMPTEPPAIVTEAANVQTVLQTALINRPDISEAIRKMRAAGVRLGVSRNELLPRLDLLVETYVADLAGSSDVGRSLQGQFTENRPGFTLGFEFEVPLGNRAAVAKLEQRQWELKRSINIFRATVEKSLTDVEIANREVQTAYSEILSRFQSMKAADKESRYLKDRFEVLPAAEDSATLLLEDLLDSFERLADEESAFVQAQVNHSVALIKLKKEMGTLLRSRNSRPQLDVTEQSWMAGRVNSSVPGMDESSSIATSPEESVFQNVSQGQVVYEVGHQGFDMGTSSNGTTAIVEEPMIDEGEIEYSEAVPIPRTPTLWKRPGSFWFGGN